MATFGKPDGYIHHHFGIVGGTREDHKRVKKIVKLLTKTGAWGEVTIQVLNTPQEISGYQKYLWPLILIAEPVTSLKRVEAVGTRIYDGVLNMEDTQIGLLGQLHRILSATTGSNTLPSTPLLRVN